MSVPALARSAMRFGITLGVAAVVLIVLGPFIIGNFGDGSDPTTFLMSWSSAPSAVVVSMTYLVLVTLSLFLSAILITASLVLRHALAAEQKSGVGNGGVGNSGGVGQTHSSS